MNPALQGSAHTGAIGSALESDFQAPRSPCGEDSSTPGASLRGSPAGPSLAQTHLSRPPGAQRPGNPVSFHPPQTTSGTHVTSAGRSTNTTAVSRSTGTCTRWMVSQAPHSWGAESHKQTSLRGSYQAPAPPSASPPSHTQGRSGHRQTTSERAERPACKDSGRGKAPHHAPSIYTSD